MSSKLSFITSTSFIKSVLSIECNLEASTKADELDAATEVDDLDAEVEESRKRHAEAKKAVS